MFEIDYTRVPNPNLTSGLRGYIERGQPTGDFLQAVLSNDLYRACAKADETNARLLVDLMKWLYNHAPGACYGSIQRHTDWLRLGGLQGGAGQ